MWYYIIITAKKFVFIVNDNALPVKRFEKASQTKCLLHTVPGIEKRFIHVVSPSQCARKIHTSYALISNRVIFFTGQTEHV